MGGSQCKEENFYDKSIKITNSGTQKDMYSVVTRSKFFDTLMY